MLDSCSPVSICNKKYFIIILNVQEIQPTRPIGGIKQGLIGYFIYVLNVHKNKHSFL